MNKATSLFLLFFLLLCSKHVFASCLELQGEPTLEWTAYKTPLKVPVKGTFTEQKRTGPQRAPTLEKLLKNQNLKLITTSVETENKSRNKNVINAFFKKMAGPQEITAIIKTVTKKTLGIEITMNNRVHYLPLKYQLIEKSPSQKTQTLMAHGHLDLLDLALSEPLKAINKACYALHEGKTWSHVYLQLTQALKVCSP